MISAMREAGTSRTGHVPVAAAVCDAVLFSLLASPGTWGEAQHAMSSEGGIPAGVLCCSCCQGDQIRGAGIILPVPVPMAGRFRVKVSAAGLPLFKVEI